MRRNLVVLGACLVVVAAATYFTSQSANSAVSLPTWTSAATGFEIKPGGAAFANLDGFAELSPDGRRGAGDADGWGGAVVTVKGTQLCFGITVNLISTPVAAHVHVGKPSESGPVVAGLVAPSSGDPGASSGCVAVSDELADAIRTHPQDYYVNVHTADFPAGAVRGQLFHPTER